MGREIKRSVVGSIAGKGTFNRAMTNTISVIICAYTEKRWDDLIAAIESVLRQTTAANEIVVVIDHNTLLLERVQREFAGRSLQTLVQFVANEQPKGLSGARNTGIAVSKGDWLAFLDDDATADVDWLAHLSVYCAQPAVMGAGGMIVPRWEADPAWFPVEFYWVVGCTYRGMPINAAPVRNLIGANMFIRREVFAAVGGFHVGMGRVDAIPLGCEETEVCIRARQHWPDRQFMYEPAARVHHRVPADRITYRYFRSRCYAEGLSKAAVSRLVGAGDGLSSERSYTLRILPSGVLYGLRDMLFKADVNGLKRAVAIVTGLFLTTLGFLAGTMQQSRTVAAASAPIDNPA